MSVPISWLVSTLDFGRGEILNSALLHKAFQHPYLIEKDVYQPSRPSIRFVGIMVSSC